MTINFIEKFENLKEEFTNGQKRLSIKSILIVYYGISIEKHFRISFVSKNKPLDLTSTKEIQVIQGKENDNIYWTCFDLINENIKDTFFIFCNSLVETILNVDNEYEALCSLRDRYYSWCSLLKNKNTLSYEQYQGLYGELFYMVEYLSKNMSINDVINSWVGPEGYSKDFSINNTWYEIKTICPHSSTIKINSLTQLDSNEHGHLVVITLEKMSSEFDDKLSNVLKLYRYILSKIECRELKELFVNKVLRYGFVDDNNLVKNYNFEVKMVNSYLVNESFPKITKKDIKFSSISNVNYEILISLIDEFKENY